MTAAVSGRFATTWSANICCWVYIGEKRLPSMHGRYTTVTKGSFNRYGLAGEVAAQMKLAARLGSPDVYRGHVG